LKEEPGEPLPAAAPPAVSPLDPPQAARTWSSAVVRDDTSIVAGVKVLILRIRALSYEFMRLSNAFAISIAVRAHRIARCDECEGALPAWLSQACALSGR
jgi:hypothetical protein